MTEEPAVYGTPHALDTRSPLSRVFEAASCRTQQELAAFLGVKQSTVSDAKRRDSIPAEWLITLLRKKWINPSWVMTGCGTRLLKPSENEEVLSESPVPCVGDKTAARGPPEECTTDELMREVVLRVLRMK